MNITIDLQTMPLVRNAINAVNEACRTASAPKIISALGVEPTKMTCFVCGPTSYMRSVKALLEKYGVLSNQIHFEHYGPTEDLNKNRVKGS